MTTVNEIPTQPNAQRFLITLAGITYQFTIHWCSPSACWILDIADFNGVAIVQGLPLITGADLLAQFEYLGIGGELIVQSDDSVDAVPTYANLGTIGHLYFVVP